MLRRSPDVSVVVPAFNEESQIGDTLRALQAQRFDGRFETIVVDNGSTDRTAEVVRRCGATLAFEPTRGPAAARNAGLARAQGRIVCHLDADAVPSRGWVQAMADAMADPSVVLVGGRSVSFPPKTGAERYMAASGRIDAVEYIRRPLFPFVPSRNMAVRREAATAIGGWSEEFLTGEDVEFCHRLLQRFPDSMIYAPRALLMHRNRASEEALARQAWGYGEGVANLYARYPGTLRWGTTDVGQVAVKRIGYWVDALACRVGHRLGIVPNERFERAHFHHVWKRAFWAGFASYRRTGRYAAGVAGGV